MARELLSENERHGFDNAANNPYGRLREACNGRDIFGEFKCNGLRVRFLDEEGKTARLISADEVDCTAAHVKKIHILKNRSSSETSILLRNPSLAKRRPSLEDRGSDSQNDRKNLYRRLISKANDHDEKIKTDIEKGENNAKELEANGQGFKRNFNVYSVNQAKTLSSEKKKSIPLSNFPRLIVHRGSENGHKPSSLPADFDCSEEISSVGKDFTSRAIGRLSRGLGRLLRRTNSVRISEPDPVYKVAYLGNVLTGWARGEGCIEKPLATLWRNYNQSTKPDVVMKLSVTNSGLKGFTKEHGLTEYWSHRVTYCASPPHYPRLFCWVYRHEGKKLKHELRCHAVLCQKESVSKRITEELQQKLRQALAEFKKDRISKQNARLSLANSVYENPSMPRRKILLSVGANNYRPPLERSKSAPKLGAIEELCSEEDEEEAELNAKDTFCDDWSRKSSEGTLTDLKSPRKTSCPEIRRDMNGGYHSETFSEELLKLLVNESYESYKQREEEEGETINTNKVTDASQNERSEMVYIGNNRDTRFHTLESIEETNEIADSTIVCLHVDHKESQLLAQSNFLVTDSDDGSVSSGCETASTVTSSDTEPTSLPSHFPQEDFSCLKNRSEDSERRVSVFDRIQNLERASHRIDNDRVEKSNCIDSVSNVDEVNHVPIGEKNSFRRRSTYPPLKTDLCAINDFESKFESLIDNLTSFDSLTSSTETEVYKVVGDNDSACSDESGYSEFLETGKESVIGSTIMV